MTSYNFLHAAVFKIRGIVMAPPLIFLCLYSHWEWKLNGLVWAIGLPLFCAGFGLRIWCQMYLRYRVRGERNLARTGPYGWVRNPVYIANMLMFAALCILCKLPWTVPAVCGWAFLVYSLSIRFEETRLRKRFGVEYEAYERQTPRWWPRRPTQVGISEHERANLCSACRAEWQCALLLLLPVAKEFVTLHWHIG